MPNELERELGCTLFDRTNQATMLTEDGMRLRQRAEEIVSLVDQTERDITDRTGEFVGNIRIGAGETQAMSVLAEVFVDLRREHPPA